MSRYPLFIVSLISALLLQHPASAAIPEKAVAFFTSSSCPNGWKEADYARGRLLLGTSKAADVGTTAGTPLGDAENRGHEHAYNIKMNLPHKHIAAAGGCCNGQGAKKGASSSKGKADNAASDLPFMQLLACEKEAESGGGEPLPALTALFFNGQSCPSNWTAYQPADGRFLMPLMKDGEIGDFGGGPKLTPGQQRNHAHGMKASVDIVSVKYAGISGCCNNNLAKSEDATIGGFSANADLDVPYISLFVCLKSAARTPDPAPSGMVGFFPISAPCPAGWSQTLAAPGRFLVGLPEGGQNGAAFGGPPLTDKENRTHEHPFSGKVSTTKYEVALASGCCAKGYAKHKDYTYSGTSAAGYNYASDDKDHEHPKLGALPYQQVLACSKD